MLALGCGVTYLATSAICILLYVYPSLQAENLKLKSQLVASEEQQDHIRQGVVEKESEYLHLTDLQRVRLDSRLGLYKYPSLGYAPLPSISAKEASSLQNQITAQNDRANWLTYGEMSLAATIFLLYMFPFLQGGSRGK